LRDRSERSSELQAKPGDFVHIPRGVRHRFHNIGNHAAKMLFFFTPGGVESIIADHAQPAVPGDPCSDKRTSGHCLGQPTVPATRPAPNQTAAPAPLVAAGLSPPPNKPDRLRAKPPYQRVRYGGRLREPRPARTRCRSTA
jgi:hypothetical protein